MTTRFALLRHDVPEDFGRPSHWDLLLERAGGCWTWAVDALPAQLAGGAGGSSVVARRLSDHRPHYLDYEGPVSEGRGTVARVLAGECVWIEFSELRVHVRLGFNDQSVDVLLDHESEDKWRLRTE